MKFSDRMLCRELLLSLICYEMFRGHLSPEMERIFEMHLEDCPSCRYKILAFQQMLQEQMIAPNLG